jgi:hypothetical protein
MCFPNGSSSIFEASNRRRQKKPSFPAPQSDPAGSRFVCDAGDYAPSTATNVALTVLIKMIMVIIRMGRPFLKVVKINRAITGGSSIGHPNDWPLIALSR